MCEARLLSPLDFAGSQVLPARQADDRPPPIGNGRLCLGKASSVCLPKVSRFTSSPFYGPEQ